MVEMIPQQNEAQKGTGLFTFGAQQVHATFNPALAFPKSRESDSLRVASYAQGRTEAVSLATSPSASSTSTLANLSETSDSLEITLEETKLPVFGSATPLGPKSFYKVKGMYLFLYALL